MKCSLRNSLSHFPSNFPDAENLTINFLSDYLIKTYIIPHCNTKLHWRIQLNVCYQLLTHTFSSVVRCLLLALQESGAPQLILHNGCSVSGYSVLKTIIMYSILPVDTGSSTHHESVAIMDHWCVISNILFNSLISASLYREYYKVDWKPTRLLECLPSFRNLLVTAWYVYSNYFTCNVAT